MTVRSNILTIIRMNASLMLISFGFLFALLGGWLLLRRQQKRALALAIALLLLATASLYIGTRLWIDLRKNPHDHVALLQQPGKFQVIAADQLSQALAAAHGKPVLVEFYADWCSSCVVWKNTVFNRNDVQQALTPLILLQVDASQITPAVQAQLDHYGLVGLPALLAYDRQGQEKPALRLLGEMPAEQFIQWVEQTALPALN